MIGYERQTGRRLLIVFLDIKAAYDAVDWVFSGINSGTRIRRSSYSTLSMGDPLEYLEDPSIAIRDP